MSPAGDGRLTAAGLPDQAQRFAPRDRERNAVDRMDDSTALSLCSPCGEVLDEALDVQQRNIVVAISELCP